jgi:hypothetical protein
MAVSYEGKSGWGGVEVKMVHDLAEEQTMILPSDETRDLELGKGSPKEAAPPSEAVMGAENFRVSVRAQESVRPPKTKSVR